MRRSREKQRASPLGDWPGLEVCLCFYAGVG